MFPFRVLSTLHEASEADLLVLPVSRADLATRGDEPIAGVLPGSLLDVAVAEGFEAKPRQTFFLRSVEGLTIPRLLVIGTGEGDDLRQVGVTAARQARSRRLQRIALLLPVSAADPSRGFAKFLEGFGYGIYVFDRYKSPSDNAYKGVAEVLLISDQTIDAAQAEQALVLAGATNLARTLVNEPPASMTPIDIALHAETIATTHGFEHTVLDETALIQQRFNLIMAVGTGSDNPPRLIHLVYRGEGPIERKIALIGKGVTFDTGGYSIKSSDGMTTMHSDMAGAAAVLGAADAIGHFKPAGVEVHFIVPTVENAINGRAIKPSDIVRGYGGKTVQILNTDAEGRLILADAIAYARTLDIDTIVDLATLTGASVVALGGYTAALFANDDTLARELLDSAGDAGEDLWRMPLTAKLDKLIDSPVADMKNIGKREGGAITAALFLQRWVGEERWAHLDIAGPSYFDSGDEYFSSGASGYGVATLVRFLCL